jgi:hypothetical protein
MPADSITDLIRPVAWIAAIGFATGFCGYFAVGLNAIG